MRMLNGSNDDGCEGVSEMKATIDWGGIGWLAGAVAGGRLHSGIGCHVGADVLVTNAVVPLSLGCNFHVDCVDNNIHWHSGGWRPLRAL